MELNFPLNKIKYSSENSNNVSIPLGGIGTGCVYLNSDGSVSNFKIMNYSPDILEKLQVNFSISAENSSNKVTFNLVNLSSSSENEINSFSDCDFYTSFPFGEICFENNSFPGKINFTAFNPLIPLNNIDSTIPAAFLEYEIINNTCETVSYILSGSMSNPFITPLNQFYPTKSANICGIRLSFADEDIQKAGKSEFSLGIYGENIEYQEYDSYNNSYLSSKVTLKPAESKKIRFIISWYSTYGNLNIGLKLTHFNNENLWKNYYTKYFTGADEVVYYSLSQWDRLYSETDLFRKLLFSSTISNNVISEISQNVEYIKHPDFIRYEDGCVYPLHNNYEMTVSYAMTYLFPFLERLRLQNKYSDDSSKNKTAELSVNFQFETLLSIYKQFKLSGDIKWLSEIWPFILMSIKPCFKGFENYNDTYEYEIYIKALKTIIQLSTVMRDKKHINQFSEMYSKVISHSCDEKITDVNDLSYFKSGYSLLSKFCGLEIDVYNKIYKFCPDMEFAENGVFRCFVCFEGFEGFIECGIDYFQLNCVKGSIFVRSIEVPTQPLLVKAGGSNIGFTGNGNVAILDNDCEVNPKRDLFIVLRT